MYNRNISMSSNLNNLSLEENYNNARISHFQQPHNPPQIQSNCSVILKRGIRKGQACNHKKVKMSNYCSYHKYLNKGQEEEKKTEDGKDIFCHGCSNKMNKNVSQIRLACSHNFHFKCMMILFEDEYGYIFNANTCPLCNHNIKEEMEHQCCICLDDIISDTFKTKCNHYYHKSCINDWDKTKGCPMCRQEY